MMKKQYGSMSSCILSIMMVAFLMLEGGFFLAQEANPFYLNLLKKGEKSYLAGDYVGAISELEIAAFGLLREKRPLAKAYVYMSLSYHHLKNREQSEKYLKDAKNLIGEEQLRNLEIHESAWTEFESLLNSLRPEVDREKLEIEEDVIEQELISRLENDIRENPRNVSLYYQLYDAYRVLNNRVFARRTLENLVKNNPSEISGYYLLAKLDYGEGDYREAEKIFEKVLDLSKRVQIEESLSVQVRAYLILSSYLRGKKNKAKERAFAWISDFTEEKIHALPIDIEDKQKLERIINIYKAEAEAEREKVRIKRLEEEIEKEPQNVSLYYELYELYRNKREYSRAKETLRNLVKNNPNEITGLFLLAKIEYGQRRYKEALERFRRMTLISDESHIEREWVLKSMIYVCLCLRHMSQEKSLRSYLDSLYNGSSEAEIMRLVREEGLEQEWEDIRKYVF